LVSLGVEASGSGSDVVGAFSDRNAFDVEARRAGDFFTRSAAVAAQPPENVRAVDPQSSRFEAVRGSTQLQFQLFFSSHAADAGASSSNAANTCAAVLPFDYAANTDDGTELTQGRFVLIVANDSPPLTAAQYCLPVACL
jgi:hypothetical protein